MLLAQGHLILEAGSPTKICRRSSVDTCHRPPHFEQEKLKVNTVRKTRAITRSPMKRRQSWIWEDRLLGKPTMVCNDCGHPWQQNPLPDQVRHKDALVEPPPGLQGGQKPKKMKKIKDTNLPKAIKEHWESALKVQCTALGLQAAEPPQPPRRNLQPNEDVKKVHFLTLPTSPLWANSIRLWLVGKPRTPIFLVETLQLMTIKR